MPRANRVAVQEMLLVASALLAVVSAYDSCSTLRNPEVSWNLRLRGAGSMLPRYGPGTGFTSHDACMRIYKQCTLQTCVAEGAQDNCTWCASSPGCYNSDNAPCMANRSVTDSVECWLNPKCNTKKPYCNTHQVRPSRRCSLRVPARSRCRCGRASRVLGCPVGDAAP